MQEILWALVWMLVRWLLGVSKDLMAKTLDLVAQAQALKHEDGSEYSGQEKYEWVFDHLFGYYEVNTSHNVYNILIELAVGYLKKKTVG